MIIIKNVAVGLSVLIGLGIIAIGVRFLLAPRAAAAAYGVAVNEEIRGGRCVPFGQGRARHRLRPGRVPADRHRGTRVLGAWMMVMALIPIGDAVVVLRWGGSKAAAYGWHVATAVVMVVIGILPLA